MKFLLSWLAVPVEILIFINSVAASRPLIANEVRDVDFVQKPRMSDLEVAPLHYLSKRNTSSNLGTLSLATQLTNDVLFSIGLDGLVSIAGSPNLTVVCISCFTTGTASLLSSSFTQDEALLSDIPAATAELVKDPLGFLEEALNVTFEIDFQDVAGHFDVDVSFAAAGALSFPLFHPVTPLGASIDGNLIGFIFTIDLVFSVTGQLDVTTGFDITWPNSAFITIDPIKGEILSMDVSGVQVNPLPLTFITGSGCVQVALRFGLKAGLGINLLGTSANIQAGAFVDAPAYQACAEFNSAAPCELGLTQKVFGDAGAFADIAVKIDFLQFSEGPSVVTTFFSADLPTACLASTTTLAIANTTSSKASVTAAPVYGNATTTSKYVSATTTQSASLSGNSTVYTLTNCQSDLLWCPSNLQTTITITESAAATLTASPPSVTITNAVTITVFSTPLVSTIQSTVANSTTSTTAGGDFAQQSKNTTSTLTSVATARSNVTMVSTSSPGMASVIVSIGGIAASSTSAASSSGNGTAIQLTSNAPRIRNSDYNLAALFVGVLGLVVLVR